MLYYFYSFTIIQLSFFHSLLVFQSLSSILYSLFFFLPIPSLYHFSFHFHFSPIQFLIFLLFNPLQIILFLLQITHTLISSSPLLLSSLLFLSIKTSSFFSPLLAYYSINSHPNFLFFFFHFPFFYKLLSIFHFSSISIIILQHIIHILPNSIFYYYYSFNLIQIIAFFYSLLLT